MLAIAEIVERIQRSTRSLVTSVATLPPLTEPRPASILGGTSVQVNGTVYSW